MRFAETELRDERWDPLTWVYLLGDGLFPLLAREFAPLADRLASVAGGSRGCRPCSTAPATTLVGTGRRPAGRPVPDRDRAGAAARGRRADRRGARGGRGRAADRSGRRRAAAAAGRCRRRGQGGARPTSRRHLRDDVLPAQRGRRPPGRRPVRSQDAPHDALRDADAGADPRGGRARVRRGPRRDGPARARPVADLAPRTNRVPTDDGALVRGVLDAIADRASGRRPTCSTSAATRSPGSRRSASSAT